MKELAELAQAQFETLAKDGGLERLMRAQVESCVKRAIESATDWNSPFQKALEAHVKNAMPMDFAALGLAQYNGEIIKVIKAKLDASLLQWVDKSIAESMAELLQPPLAEIKLSEFVQLLRKHVKEHNSHEQKRLDVTVRDTDNASGYWSMAMKVGNYEEYHIAVTKAGDVYSIRVPLQGEVTKTLFVGRCWGLERILWQFYAGKTKIIRDDADLDDDDGE